MKRMINGLLSRSCATAALACLALQPAAASSSWLTSVDMIDGSGSPSSSMLASNLGNRASAQATTAVFNIVISLEEDPQGDDVYPADSGTTDDAQNAFEAKIEEFADAVFQMTNGAHKIGRVVIFRDGQQNANADVRWIENCPRDAGPRANPSGFGRAGAYINFCTNWDGAPSLMDTPRGGGFTLAHEWGHYAYGIYDEYVADCGQVPESNCLIIFPRSTDTASSPSVMNNQWTAARAGGDQDWLEFSTSGVEPWASNADGDDRNAQARVFGEPAWATLTRDPASDPRLSIIAERTQYTNLVAPTGQTLSINDDESTARSALNIVWAGDRAVEMMIDTSGSMGGTPIANARAAASLLAGQLTPGSTAVGVGRFTSSASQVYPMTDIPDPDTGIRAAAQSAIAGLNSGGGTDIEDAALFALNETQTFQGGGRPSVVYLLTDGRSGVDVNRVVAEYLAANVPLVTFGFGSNVDESILRPMAEGTGGQYFFSPTTLAEIQLAFVAANAAFSNAVIAGSATTTVPASASSTETLTLDSTMGVATVAVTYPLPQSSLSLQLQGPGGSTTPQLVCSEGAEVSCTVDLDISTLGTGAFTLTATNTTSTEVVTQSIVSASTASFSPFNVAVEFGDVVYPSSMEIFATVTRGASLTGVNVTADVTLPDSTVVSIPLSDDGTNADQIADDGVYSNTVPYNQNGTYSVVVRANNASGTAQTTFNNVTTSLQEDGTPVRPTPQPVPENFLRVGLSSASASSVQSDDHGDDPSFTFACTSFSTDNVDNPGRIDSAGDVDCFRFTPATTGSNVNVRVTGLRDGMQPIIRVYDPTGTTELLSIDPAASANSASGVIGTIPASALSTLGHVVSIEHADATATQGSYSLSAGPALSSDTPVRPAGLPVPDPSGGAIGPIGLLIGLLLAVVGVTRRRPFS